MHIAKYCPYTWFFGKYLPII
uniref:Uncharacterized protein n=1 Tax=Lepeophtheirus salmonis TaxID=72036 RepID=A0A0K2TPG7_LEPSM